MAFPTAFLEELRARVGLAAVVSKRVRLIRRGREHLGLCPFHKEKTPSFTVNEDKGFYHCFGCGKHGSAFDFVMETEGLTFPEAVERLAREAGLELPARDAHARARDEGRGALLPALEAACAFFERTLRMPEGRAALEYLRGRGLIDQTIAEFRLGFAPDARGALKAALLRDKFAEERLVEAGLLIKPDDSSKGLGAAAAPSGADKPAARGTYDRFRGRVMFPIEDRQKRVVAFGGRIIGEGEPKYLNSPETPLFHKGFTLYGLARAVQAARQSGEIVVVEGYMDVIALHQAGIRVAVAPLGTALTEDQIRLLWRVAPEPILCFDGDAAGQRAAGRALERALPLLKPGFSLRFAFLPAGDDPDSLIRRQGVETMRRVLDRPLALSETLWLFETAAGRPNTPGARSAPSYGSGVVTPEARAALEDRLRRHVQRIEDPTLRAHFLQAFRDRARNEFRETRPAGAFGVPPARGRGRGAPAPSRPVPPIGPAARAALATQVDARFEAECFMLALAVNHCRLFPEIEEELGTVRFADPRLDRLRQELLRVLGGAQGEWTAAEVQAMLADEAASATLAEVLAHPPIKAHRLARPEAPLAEARAAWVETARLRERLASRDEPGAPPVEAEALTAEPDAWERRKAQLAARLGGDEAAE
jgi:DNA primase